MQVALFRPLQSVPRLLKPAWPCLVVEFAFLGNGDFQRLNFGARARHRVRRALQRNLRVRSVQHHEELPLFYHVVFAHQHIGNRTAARHAEAGAA